MSLIRQSASGPALCLSGSQFIRTLQNKKPGVYELCTPDSEWSYETP